MSLTIYGLYETYDFKSKSKGTFMCTMLKTFQGTMFLVLMEVYQL